MGTLSIRNVPPAIEHAIEREAKRRNTTRTAVVVTALHQVFVGDAKKSVVRRDLRSFFGQMSEEELADFKKATAPFNETHEAEWR